MVFEENRYMKYRENMGKGARKHLSINKLQRLLEVKSPYFTLYNYLVIN
jgi:hypothetical protein